MHQTFHLSRDQISFVTFQLLFQLTTFIPLYVQIENVRENRWMENALCHNFMIPQGDIMAVGYKYFNFSPDVP